MGKALAMVTTSKVHCYPDGLLSSDDQYTLKHFPMQWLHSFELNKSSSYHVEKLDGDVLRSLINISESEEDIVLGRFDFDIDSAIKHVKDKIMDQGKDIIEIMIDVDKKELEKEDKFCEDGHRNVNPRANLIRCKVCNKNIFKPPSPTWWTNFHWCLWGLSGVSQARQPWPPLASVEIN